jgi:SPX domain protein involved in polyphosphate accumulation
MAAATPKTPSDAQPTSENITYEATLNAAASASRFPAGAFLDYAGLKKILEALAEMYATGDRAAEGLAYASLATTGRDAAAAVKRAPSSFQVSSHEAFLEKLDGELAKCDDFAHREVVKVKRELAELESGGSRPRSGSLDGDPEEVEGWRVDAVGQHFLEVEKYVNVIMPDSQLVNSVYLDSPALELYHGRLNKTPGAVALRLRWYGTGEPTLVFVERKKNRV